MPGLEPGIQQRLDCRFEPGNDNESTELPLHYAGEEPDELVSLVLNGPVAHAGATIVRRRLGAVANVVEVDRRTADAEAVAAFAETEVLVSVDFDGCLPTPRLRLRHVPVRGARPADHPRRRARRLVSPSRAGRAHRPPVAPPVPPP